MYNNKVILMKIYITTNITGSMLPVDCYNNTSFISFTTDDMTSKYELFSKKKVMDLYLTEII